MSEDNFSAPSENLPDVKMKEVRIHTFEKENTQSSESYPFCLLERLEDDSGMEEFLQYRKCSKNALFNDDSSDDSDDICQDSQSDDGSEFCQSEESSDVEINERDHDKGDPQPGSSKGSSGEFRNRSRASRCPPPAPAPHNRNRKRKRKYEDKSELELSQELKNMVVLLRTRTSVRPLKDPEGSKDKSTNSDFFSKSFTYASINKSINTWGQNLHEKVINDYGKFVKDHFTQFLCSNVVEKLKKEFFFWSQTHYEGFTSPNLNSNWKMAYFYLTTQHPEREKYCKQYLQDAVKEAGIRCLIDLDTMNRSLLNTLILMQEWRADVDKAMTRKLIFMKKFRSLETEIENKDKRLDEFCHWGKKTLQTLISAPYFKLSQVDYTCLVRPESYLENIYGDGEAIPTESKQKWTRKDIVALKRIIRDVRLDSEYASIVRKYNYISARITHERSSHLHNEEESLRSASGQLLDFKNVGYNISGCGSRTKAECTRANTKKRGAKCEFLVTTVRRKLHVPGDNDVIALAKYSVKANELQKWFQQQEFALRQRTYEELMKEDRIIENIDWHAVANRLTTEIGKPRSATDCRLVWLHCAHPNVSNTRWSSNDTMKLMELGRCSSFNWNEIACQIGGGRTAYQCFLKYRNHNIQTGTMKWDANRVHLVREVLIKEGPKWGKSVEATMDIRATKLKIKDHWKKNSNPMLRNGAFTRVEDALLLLCLEKLRRYLQAEGQFGILLAYLPWRFESAWRDRACNLFSCWIVPWTIEEDKKLLDLVRSQRYGRNWHKISNEFTSFKNRKGCLTRYKILTSKIGDGPSQFKSVEEYHEAYSMTRYNVFQYSHLRDIVKLLERIIVTKSPSAPFPGLNPHLPPSELELRWMLIDYDKDIMRRTIKNLEQYIESRDNYWRNWITYNGQIIKTFDRRTFHREDPKSVASAIHIRRLEMIPQNLVQGSQLTAFESDVYFHHARFCRTKPLSDGISRPYIPTALQLSKMTEISRIVKLSPNTEVDHSAEDKINGENPIFSRTRGRPRKSFGPTPAQNPDANGSTRRRSGRLRKSVTGSGNECKGRKISLNSIEDFSDNVFGPSPPKKVREAQMKSDTARKNKTKSAAKRDRDSNKGSSAIPLRRSTRNCAQRNYKELPDDACDEN